jgi:hypothetical protein
MAVIEIAKIQVRRGQENQTGMPQLDSGEFGWAEDTEHLYIGKRIVDGATSDENTRILTEGDLDNIFNLLANTTTNITYYKYRNQAPWIHASGTFVQHKLDLQVSLNDYGVLPVTTTTSTVVDITVAFQNAVNDLFNNGTAPVDARRELLIPAGNWAISNVINLPSYTTLKGAGQDITNISLYTSSTNMFRTVGTDGTTYYTYDGDSGPGSDLASQSASVRPKDIRIEGMTLKYQNTLTQESLIAIDNARDVTIKNVKFTSTATSYDAGIGIHLRGQGGTFASTRINDGYTQNIEIIDCDFSNMKLGVLGTGTVIRPVIDGNKFEYLNRGVSFYTIDTLPGPSDGFISKNRFHNIVQEGLYVGANPNNFRSNHLSTENFYGFVGNGSGFNDFQTTSTTFYPLYTNAATTSGSSVNTFVVNSATYTIFNTVNPTAANWYVVSSNNQPTVYSQITGTVVKAGNNMTFQTTSANGPVDFGITGTVVTLGYIEHVVPAVTFNSPGNKTVGDVFSRKVLADQGPGSSIESITVANPLVNGPYTNPTVTISAPDLVTGVNATANANIDDSGHITSITITNKGYGYINAPTVTITGNGGTAAVLTVNVVNEFHYTPYISGIASVDDVANFTTTINPGQTVSFTKLPLNSYDQKATIDYQISSNTLSRKGTILVNIAPDGYVALNENYSYLLDLIVVSPASFNSVFPSQLNQLWLPASGNSWIGNIPSSPTNYYVIGSGVYDGLAARITQIRTSSTYYVIDTVSDPQFDYSNTTTSFTIGLSDDSQPVFGYTKNTYNNYIEMSCSNPSVLSTATLEYKTNIQLL